MMYLATFIYRHRRQKMTSFTALMLFTIGLGLAIGFAEAIIFLVATDDEVSRNLRAQHFIFYGCGLHLTLLSEIQNYVEWLSAMLLAHKYHIVALTIESITKTGDFLHQATQLNVFRLYIGIALACAAQIVVEESLLWKFTVGADLSRVLKTQTSNTIVTTFFITLLIFLFFYSYVKITHTLKSSQLNMSINKTMLIVNICLLLVILLTWVMQAYIYQTGAHIAFFTSYGLSTVAKLLIRVVFLVLTESFGQNLNLMSKLTAEGELVIYGCDEAGKQLFSYTMQKREDFTYNQNADDESQFINFAEDC